jgi:hypothetical protein
MTQKNTARPDNATSVGPNPYDVVAELVANNTVPFLTIAVMNNEAYVPLKEFLSRQNQPQRKTKVAKKRGSPTAEASDPDDEKLKLDLQLARAILRAIHREIQPNELKRCHREPHAKVWRYANDGGFLVRRETVTQHINIADGNIRPDDNGPIGSIRHVLNTHERIILGVLKGKYRLTDKAFNEGLPESITRLCPRYNIGERELRTFLRAAWQSNLPQSSSTPRRKIPNPE